MEEDHNGAAHRRDHDGQRVVYVETEEEFWRYINLGPVSAPQEIAESLGFTDVLSPEEWDEELKGEREWEAMIRRRGQIISVG